MVAKAFEVHAFLVFFFFFLTVCLVGWFGQCNKWKSEKREAKRAENMVGSFFKQCKSSS